MRKLSHYEGLLDDRDDVVQRALELWSPSSTSPVEAEHEEDLFRFLTMHLNGVEMVRQYGIAKNRADLVIEDKVAVELKMAFSEGSIAEFDRWVGQMERLRQKWVNKSRGSVFTVIIGEMDSTFRHMVHEVIAQMDRGTPVNKWFYLVEKPIRLNSK